MSFDSTLVKIDLDAISANFEAVRKKAGVAVMAVIKAENDERGVRVWSHTSKALKRHKKTYVKVMKRALSGAIYRVAPWAERVWAVTWHWHPCVNETIKRVLDAENQGWIPGTQLLIWRLLGVELDLYEARLHAGYVRTQEG